MGLAKDNHRAPCWGDRASIPPASRHPPSVP
jgi:hypothetical protein